MFKDDSIQKRVETAIKALKKGKSVIVIDDFDRENEGDLIFAGEMATEENVAFMLQHTSGIVCLAMDSVQAKKLDLSPMVATDKNDSAFTTPFTVTIEAKEGVTTGVSAKDRAHTIKVASNINTKAEQLAKPGHIFPLIANDKGVLARNGHTEATVDLMKLSGFNSAGVLCELMNPNGTMMNAKDLEAFSKKHKLPILTIEELYLYRLSTENFIEKKVSTTIPLKNIGHLDMTVYEDKFSKEEVVVMSKKYQDDNPLVRIHSSCLTGDLFGSLKCDCQSQLHHALEEIHKEGGYVIYLNQEGRGIGLVNKLKAYNLQNNENMDTVEANEALGLPVDLRKYDLAIQVLKYNNVDKCRLLSNNPDKVNALESCGIKTELTDSESFINQHNEKYLITKVNKLKHTIKGLVNE